MSSIKLLPVKMYKKYHWLFLVIDNPRCITTYIYPTINIIISCLWSILVEKVAQILALKIALKIANLWKNSNKRLKTYLGANGSLVLPKKVQNVWSRGKNFPAIFRGSCSPPKTQEKIQQTQFVVFSST